MNPSISSRRLVLPLSVIGAGLIHLAAVRSHIGSPAAVASFLGIGMVQILLGTSLLQPGALALKRVAVGSLSTLALGAWLVSRTWGLPGVSGHSAPEAVGAADAAAVALQLIALALVLLPVRVTQAHRPRRIPGALLAVATIAVSAVASVSLISVPPHSDHPRSHPQTAPAASVSGARLVKRDIPIPVTTPAPGADHADVPGVAAHSH